MPASPQRPSLAAVPPRLVACGCCGLLFGDAGLRLHQQREQRPAKTPLTPTAGGGGTTGSTEAIVSYTVDLARTSIASGRVPAVPLDAVHRLETAAVHVASRSRDLQHRTRRDSHRH